MTPRARKKTLDDITIGDEVAMDIPHPHDHTRRRTIYVRITHATARLIRALKELLRCQRRIEREWSSRARKRAKVGRKGTR